eukprot:Clim_evm16s9 gene=Clim_evmTU16s9
MLPPVSPETAKVAGAVARRLGQWIARQEMRAPGKLLVVSGAGLSTDSGLPDYRSPGRPPHRPMTIQEFLADPVTRRRYWARSMLAWERFNLAQPNHGHRALQELELQNLSLTHVTQNVDGIQQKAGSERVVELHGSVNRAFCLNCKSAVDREEFQRQMLLYNPDWATAEVLETARRPDGDVALDRDDFHAFSIPACPNCEASDAIQPGVVMFGAALEPGMTEHTKSLVDEASSVLVVGSTLTVYSGYRMIKQAATDNKPIAIVNVGNTRGDHHAELTFHYSTTELLPLAFKDALEELGRSEMPASSSSSQRPSSAPQQTTVSALGA